MSVIDQLNSAPYFDDFSPSERDFLRILFRPGYGVQARELNQLQSILQTQVERFGNHVFKNGSIVIGGQSTIDVNTSKYLKLQDNVPSTTTPINLAELLNKEIIGESGAKAKVVAVSEKVNSDPNTLIIKMLNGISFVQNENISINYPTAASDVAQILNVSDFYGNSSTVSIGDGIFFTRGMFVVCESQTAILEKYSNTPTKKAGLVSAVTIVTENNDVTLLDNANGSYNYAAPGAHRLKINLTLEAKDLSYSEDLDTFIEILEVRDGSLYKQTRNSAYSELGKTLARRTYDESGDYTVYPFIMNLEDHPSDTAKLRAYISPGKAYVKGQEFETIAQQYIDIDKARTTESYSNYDVTASYDNYIIVTLEEGLPDISSYEKLNLYNASNTLIGTARVRNIELYTSTPLQYKLFIFDVNLTSGTTADIVNIANSSPAGTPSKLFTGATGAVTGPIFAPSNNTLVFDTGYAAVKSITGEQFTYRKLYTSVSTVPGATGFTKRATIDTPKTDGSERFFGTAGTTLSDSVSVENYIITNATGDEVIPHTTYQISLDTPGSTAKQTATINFESGTPSTINVIATINNNNAVANTKTKILVATHSGYIQAASTGNTMKIGSTASDVNDFYAGGKIKIVSGTGSGTVHEITGYNGTTKVLTLSTTGAVGTDSYYEICPAFTAATTDLTKGYVYFSGATGFYNLGKPDAVKVVRVLNHTSAPEMDDWFDSTKNVSYKFNFDSGQRDSYYDMSFLMPKSEFSSLSGHFVAFFEYLDHGIQDGFFTADSYPDSDEVYTYTSSSGKVIDLKNAIDFRPIKSDASTFVASKLAIPNSQVDFDIEYYLARIDKIAATSDSVFTVISGTPSLIPKIPKNLDNAMTMYTIKLQPYTYTKNDATVQYIENKRYTMRDIGKLEKRLDDLEYYASLSLLESKTSLFDVKDATGALRYKNGFLVDSFQGHNIGDVFNPDYKCAIDPVAQELRPSFKQNAYKLSLLTSTGVSVRGNLATRSFGATGFINQELASRSVNVNPYSVFLWRGSISLSPSSDYWKDTKSVPTNINNPNGLNDNMVFGNQVFSSNFNDWETNWAGTENTTLLTSTEESSAAGTQNAWGRPSVTVPGTTTTLEWVDPVTGANLQEPVWVRRAATPESTFITIVPSIYPGQATQQTVTPSNTIPDSESVRTTTTTSTNFTTIQTPELIVGVNATPFIRPRVITFTVTGLKPSTVVYPYFDDKLCTIYVTPTGGTRGGMLTSSATGTVSGEFSIPSGVFLTGDRVFRVTDSATNNRSQETTYAETRYTAFGLEEQRTVMNIPIPHTTILNEITRVENVIVRSPIAQPVDPVAQSFFVDPVIFPEGLFVSDVDLFFKTKDNNIPVMLQIRENVNGYPSNTKIVGEVTKVAADVNVSSTASTATNFQFPQIVYLEPGEYSLVVISNSNNYEVWVAQIGEERVGTTALISEQPYVGSFFTSQNASTWTANQTQDLTFRINRCYFAPGNFEMVLTDWSDTDVDNKVTLETMGATGIGASSLTISSLNSNNIVVGTKITGTSIPVNTTLTGVNMIEGKVTFGATGITAAINNGSDITFYRKAGVPASGGKMDLVRVNNSTFNPFSSTSLVYSYESTPVGGSIETSYTNIVPGKNVPFSTQKEIDVAGETFKVKLSGAVSSNLVSPVVNLSRQSFIAVENIINNTYDTEVGVPSGGNSIARYITRKIVLDGINSYMKVYLTANKPSSTGINVYYKILGPSASGRFDEQPWQIMEIETPGESVYTVSEGEFVEYVYRPVSPTYATNIGEFTEFAIKIVMTSSNTSVVPRIADFRVIATE